MLYDRVMPMGHSVAIPFQGAVFQMHWFMAIIPLQGKSTSEPSSMFY